MLQIQEKIQNNQYYLHSPTEKICKDIEEKELILKNINSYKTRKCEKKYYIRKINETHNLVKYEVEVKN